MTRPPKIEANTNRDRAPEPKQKVKDADYAKPMKHGNQAGTFVGAPAGIHVHIVGDNTHIIVKGERTEIKLKGAAKVKLQTWTKARQLLVSKGGGNSVPGYKNCLAWLDANK